MGISVQAFIDKYNGKSVAVPWGYQGECVSLVQRYTNEVAGVPLQARGNAIDYGDNLIRNGYGTAVSTPKYGDILVYGANYGGGYGHVVIYIDANTIFDQNNGSKQPTRSALHRNMLKGYKQIIRLKNMPSDVKYEDETYAFTPNTGVNIRDGHSTSANRVGGLAKGETYNYIKKYNDGKHVWVSNGKTWVAVREVKNGVRQPVWGELHAQKETPKPATFKKGDRVRVNWYSGIKYATGQNIPQWVGNETYTILDDVVDGKARLSQINSYVYTKDLKKA